jgi:cytochrome c biogenesis protein CcmG, thiol:disulfide interchange protein DsbE
MTNCYKNIFRTTILLRFIFISLFMFSVSMASAQVKSLFTEKSLPDVEVQTLDGNKVNIADFGKTGKITILNFWATWCAPCKQELTNIQELVAVSIDDSRNISKVKSYVNGNKWIYTVLLDPNQDLRRAFNFQAPPFTVLIDQNGNIIYTHNGYKNGDEFLLEDKIKTLVRKN